MNTGLYVTLYYHCVKRILLYGSEVWSVDFLINKTGVAQMENRYELFIPEKNQLKFFKTIMGVHKYSVNDAVRAEFGILPLAIFWPAGIHKLLGSPGKSERKFFGISILPRQHEFPQRLCPEI